jgi:tRNA(Ile)-lysidine synthase
MLLKKVQKTIQEYGLLKKKDKILIAYSGGADSTALLHLLLELRDEWSFELFLGHFNHKLRQSAEEDEQFVRDVAQKQSLPVCVGSGDVRAQAESLKLNIEEAGRKMRYEFLYEEALKIGGAKIATGHTITDQAETLLIRLMRGSGLRGLAGIFPSVKGKVVRPLLEVEREEIEAYLKAKKIDFREDESNLDRRFLRNRIRMDLLPSLRENYEPAIVKHLGKMASIIREEDALLGKMAQEKANELIVKKNGRAFLELQRLPSFPRAIARRVVRSFITDLRGSLRRISFEDVESILDLAEGKEYSLKEDLVLRREGDQVFLKQKTALFQYEYEWEGEDVLVITELGLSFSGEKKKSEDFPDFSSDDQARALLDIRKLKFPLVVRNRREGDRYQPLGAPGQKKVKEIMRAKGIPLSQRVKHPVFLSGKEIVWILGLPVSERFKIGKITTDLFEIKQL